MSKSGVKGAFIPFLILIPVVVFLQFIFLKDHLRYGFADVDWMFLLGFKELAVLFDNPVANIVESWKRGGVYTYQYYYIGLIENFFGLNYSTFQNVTIIFKIISTLSIYPLICLVTKNRLASFLATILYAVCYSSVGVMYTVVTSGLFVAIPVMSLFFIWYYHLLTQEKNSFAGIFTGTVLFFATILLATERMYPLVPTVALIELFWWFKNGYTKVYLFKGLKRLSPFLVLFLAYFFYSPTTFTLLSGNTEVTYNKLLSGNWQVILSPVISLGSLFLPKDYWIFFGVPKIENISSYIIYLLTEPMVIFFFLTMIMSFFIATKKIKFIRDILLFTFIAGMIVYVLSTHNLSIAESLRMNFDLSYIVPALIGSYILSLTLVLFNEWNALGKKNSLLICMVGAIVIAFVFILTTWIPADYVLVFTGVHRYLTIPGIGSSIFLAGLISIFFNKLRSSKTTRPFAFTIFLVLIPIFIMNWKIIGNHMKYELEFTGTDATEHTRMKSKLWSYLNNFSKSEPSIFYFDESQDYVNGYFDETTIMAGFNFWMRFRGSEIVSPDLAPVLFRSNLICPEPRSMCLNKVKSYITEENGIKGISYGDIFYKPENFYAFRFINRDIVNIRSEVVEAIGLE